MHMLSKMFPIPVEDDPCEGSTVLLSGGEATCKSSLAFQACISILAEDPAAQVVVLSPEPIPKLPLPMHHMSQVKASYGARLLIHNFKHSGDLIRFLSRLHSKGNLPTAIFIEDLHVFTGDRRTVGDQELDALTIASKIIPLAVDVIGHCAQELKKDCLLIMTTRDEDALKGQDQMPIIGRLFIDYVVKIKKQLHLNSPDRTCFVMEVPGGTTVSFYSEDGVLFLNNIREEIPSSNFMTRLTMSASQSKDKLQITSKEE